MKSIKIAGSKKNRKKSRPRTHIEIKIRNKKYIIIMQATFSQTVCFLVLKKKHFLELERAENLAPNCRMTAMRQASNTFPRCGLDVHRNDEIKSCLMNILFSTFSTCSISHENGQHVQHQFGSKISIPSSQ